MTEEGRKREKGEGRKEGRKAGRTEKEGRKEGRSEGRKVRTEGKACLEERFAKLV